MGSEVDSEKGIAELSGNLFFQTKAGFKAHVQVKASIHEGEKLDIVTLLGQLEESVIASGARPESISPVRVAPKNMDNAADETFGAKPEKPKADGECPNGCGKRPWIEGTEVHGRLSKSNKAYKSFWGECRTCGYKERK